MRPAEFALLTVDFDRIAMGADVLKIKSEIFRDLNTIFFLMSIVLFLVRDGR